MANNITQYNATAGSNTAIDSISIDEGMAASNVNNAIRSLMSHLKNVDTGSQALTALSVTGNVTVAGNIQKTSGDFTLDVAGDINLDSDSGYVLFKDGGTEHARIFQNNSGDVNIGSQISDKDMKFTGNDGGVAITALTLDMSNDGHATFKNGVTLTDGNLVVANGHGIDFSAAGNASGMSSELLSDYEEGTFTPTVFDSGGNNMNLAQAAGFYTKIGRSVHINFYIVLASSGSTFAANQIYIGGLPFTNANVTNNVNMHQMVRSNVDSISGYHEVIAYIDKNRNYYQLLHGGDNVSYENFRGTALSNSCQLVLTAHYFVS